MRVPSHIGVARNEKVDKQADHVTKTNSNPTTNNIPTNDIKKSINKSFHLG